MDILMHILLRQLSEKLFPAVKPFASRTLINQTVVKKK